MDRWRGRVALVTGASVGIGAAITKTLVKHGMKVLGCARNVEQIEKLAVECLSAGYSGVLIPYKCNLSSEEEILSMFSAIKSRHGGVDVCINNAGLAQPEPLLSGRTEGWRTMIDVNIVALSVCTREAYQSMKERDVDDGHIIHINRFKNDLHVHTLYMICVRFLFLRGTPSGVFSFSQPVSPCRSMLGHRVVPNAAVHFYSATKYAVTALTEGLRQELREARSHIRATCISPGLVETEFAFRLYSKDLEKGAAFYNSIKCLEADDIANAVTYVLSSPPHVQIGDIQMRPVEQVS